MEPSLDSLKDQICRICFEGEGVEAAASLVSPCRCRGTQGWVHEACLFRWRRLQVLQGKLAKAAKCELCGARYAANLDPPGKPLTDVFRELWSVLFSTLQGLVIYVFFSPLWPLLAFGAWWVLGPTGLIVAIWVLSVLLPGFIFLLYTKGLKLSLLGSPPQVYLGLTSFGPPVDGLSSGMLLVSIRAGGPFRQAVLYVMEHSDAGTMAVILNKVVPGETDGLKPRGDFKSSVRDGGPVHTQRTLCIHNIQDVPGAERLLRGKPVFLSRNLPGNLPQALRSFWVDQNGQARPQRDQVGQALLLQGLASWGERQLDGEVRSGAWGFVRSEHVKPEDILEMDEKMLEGAWEKLIGSPQLEIFQG